MNRINVIWRRPRTSAITMLAGARSFAKQIEETGPPPVAITASGEQPAGDAMRTGPPGDREQRRRPGDAPVPVPVPVPRMHLADQHEEGRRRDQRPPDVHPQEPGGDDHCDQDREGVGGGEQAAVRLFAMRQLVDDRCQLRDSSGANPARGPCALHRMDETKRDRAGMASGGPLNRVESLCVGAQLCSLLALTSHATSRAIRQHADRATTPGRASPMRFASRVSP